MTNKLKTAMAVIMASVMMATAVQAGNAAHRIFPSEKICYPEKSIDFSGLTEENPDFVCWLSFHFNPPDKNKHIDIEAPVPLETETDYYLHHDYLKNKDKNGCIFMDYQSDPSLYGYNDFLYAHHASDGSLFGTLNHIYETDRKWILKHPQYMYLYTKTACHKYIMAGYEQIDDSNNNYAYTTCDDAKMYHEYIQYIITAKNRIPSDEIQLDCSPEIMNFSTCDGPPGTSRRFVVHFIKIMAYAYSKN